MLLAFVLWLYLAWLLGLSGALFVRALSLHSAAPAAENPLLTEAMRVLQVIIQGHRLGEAI